MPEATRKKQWRFLLGKIPIPDIILLLGLLPLFAYATYKTFDFAPNFRIGAIHQFGHSLTGLAPWTNCRNAEVVTLLGPLKFLKWYDTIVNYPFGRPTGTNTYPGLPFATAAWYPFSQIVTKVKWSITENCVLFPAWLSAFGCAFVAFLGWEATGTMTAGAAAAYLYAFLPAHMMHTAAAEYNVECLVAALMILTSYLWLVSLRGPRWWPVGLLAGVAYGYSQATWSGAVFTVQLLAVHAVVVAAADWAADRYQPSLLYAYTLMYVVGTAMAVCVPPVGRTALLAADQLPGLAALLVLGTLHVCERLRRRAGIASVRSWAATRQRVTALFGLAALGAVVLAASGLVLPARPLFSHFTRRPLTSEDPMVNAVDGGAAPAEVEGFYDAYLSITVRGWPAGLAVLGAVALVHRRVTPGKLFLVVYSCLGWALVQRLALTVMLAAPAAVVCTGYLVGGTAEEALWALFWERGPSAAQATEAAEDEALKKHKKTDGDADAEEKEKEKAKTKASPQPKPPAGPRWGARAGRHLLGIALLLAVAALSYKDFADSKYDETPPREVAYKYTHPYALFLTTDPHPIYPGSFDAARDFMDAVFHLRYSCPRGVRVLSWVDNGEVISSMSYAASLVDFETTDRTQLGLVGKMLTLPPVEAHRMIRHMADLVLVVSVGDKKGPANGKEYIRRSIEMAQAADAAFPGHCPGDAGCRNFYTTEGKNIVPSKMMNESLVLRLSKKEAVDMITSISETPAPDVEELTNGPLTIPFIGNTGDMTDVLFKLIFRGGRDQVRIYQVVNASDSSRTWVATRKNQVCTDEWKCRGQYPPAPEIEEWVRKAA